LGISPTDAVQTVADGKVFLVLDRKGSGKTALVRYFAEGEKDKLPSAALSLRGYPWGIHATRKNFGASDVDAYVSSWRYLIAVQLASLLLKTIPDVTGPAIRSLKNFLVENYGSSEPGVQLVLRPSALKLSKTSFEPTVLGVKLFSISLERSPNAADLGTELDALTDSILSTIGAVSAETGISRLFLHFDELDQGLSTLEADRAQMLTGLILAARGVKIFFSKVGQVEVNPVIYLRTDLWRAPSFSDKNKISRASSLTLEWDSRTLKDLVDARLKARFRRATKFEDIEDGDQMRGSQQKFNHILYRTFLRPRDVIQFINCGLTEARHRDDEPLLLSNQDIINARDPYSNYLKDELDDEIKSIWPAWDRSLNALAAIATMTFTRDQFEHEFEKHKSDDTIDSENALRILYEFSVVGYETRSGYGGSGWAFQYTNPEAGWDVSAPRFKVHAGLKEYA
jgi:hypothetical protein